MNDHLRKGGVLIIWQTAGKLANWSLSGLQEHKWNPGLQLAMRNNAALVPIHITEQTAASEHHQRFYGQSSNMMVIREASPPSWQDHENQYRTANSLILV